MTDALVDSNVILDLFTQDRTCLTWSSQALAAAHVEGRLVINPVIYAEVSIHFSRVEELNAALPPDRFLRQPIPFDAAFLAGKAYLQYRREGGPRQFPLPDFFIGAHAAVAGFRLITRDAARFRSYFPTIMVVAPP